MFGASEPSSLAEFLRSLFETGRVRVAEPEAAARDFAQGDDVLLACERRLRRELPHAPPRFDPPAARWGAAMFYRACQFVAYRNLGVAEMHRSLEAPCPGMNSPAVHYSVDLTFRYLPDLVRLARTTAEQDPLLERLTAWANQWPLSSVGMKDVSPAEPMPLVNDPCLLAFYADRIIERRDLTRLADPRVREAVRQALGLFPEMAPEVAAAIEEQRPLEAAHD